jgi:AraC family transcriptional regulator of adaptative response / DNA-3-methyladenine glycosylase II
MRLIADGVIDRDGVSGVARRLAVSERHLHRIMVAELGAGPLAIARAQRAQTARTLIETTALSFTEVAFAAGFASTRQFNDTIAEVFALTPTALRASAHRRCGQPSSSLTLRLPFRPPLDWAGLISWLGTRAIPGVAEVEGNTYRRTMRLPGGAAIVQLEPAEAYIRCTLQLESIADLASAVLRCRRLLDLDADPTSVADVLSADSLLRPLIRRNRGLRSPGTVDGTELAIQAVMGQQVSLGAARTLTARLVRSSGDAIKMAHPTLTHLFPTAGAIAAADLTELGVPASRRATLIGMANSIASGSVSLDPGADRAEVYQRLTALPGIGEWTAGYILMRALGDPDTFLATDLGIRKAAALVGLGNDPKLIATRATAWSPWRTYATHHLWSTLAAASMKGAA